MRVLVTRPVEEARDTAAKLERMGHAPVIAPLFEVRYLKTADISLDGVQAVLVTSANGIRALALHMSARDLPVFAVGRRSAEVARALGFHHVESADGDAGDLAALIARKLSARSGALLHVGGIHVADHFGALETAGFVVRRVSLYEARALKTPSLLIDSLRGNALDAALFFSPRAARIFAERVRAAGLDAHCRRLLAACISAAAADEILALNFHEIRVAARPDQEFLLGLLPVENGAPGL